MIFGFEQLLEARYGEFLEGRGGGKRGQGGKAPTNGRQIKLIQERERERSESPINEKWVKSPERETGTGHRPRGERERERPRQRETEREREREREAPES